MRYDNIKLICITLFLLFFVTNNIYIFGMENDTQSLFTPKSIIGVGLAFVSIKFGYDATQKMFNANARSIGFNQSKIFDLSQGGYQNLSIIAKSPNTPTEITIKFKRLTPQEETREFNQGIYVLGACVATAFGSYYLLR